MFLHIQNVLTAEEIAFFQQHLGPDAPGWTEHAAQGPGAAPEKQPAAVASQRAVCPAAGQGEGGRAPQRPVFSAALPRRIFNPLFNNYGDSANYYGNHVDSAVMHSKADGCWVRSDLSCTLFLTAPEDYDGGELVIARPWAKSASSCPRAI